MKKILLALFLLAGLGVTVGSYAQDAPAGGWEFGAGLVFYNVYDSSHGWGATEITSGGSTGSYDDADYESSPVRFPSLHLTFGYNFPKYHLGLFMSAYYTFAYNNLEGGPSLLQERESILHVLPEVRVYYSFEKRVRMYAAVGYGLRYRRYDESFQGTDAGYNAFGGTFTIIPFGISVGEKAGFSLDVGVGRTSAPLAMRFTYLF